MKIASYLYRRKSALLKGLVLGCTVWLTVTVLLFMEDRRITPTSNDQSAAGGAYQPQPAAQRLSAVGVGGDDDGGGGSDDNRLLDEEFPLEGGVEPAQRAVNANQQQPAAKTSSRRSHAAAGGPENGEGVLPQPNGGGDDDGRKSYGEMGKPVVLPANLTSDIKKLVDEGWKNNAFNQYASDLISLHRTLPDPRDEWCKKPGRYLDNLPQTSVIVCFHNEAWSVLLRTVHSILDRSPEHLIREIILVDDFSDMPHLKTQLEEYLENYPKVKIVRAKKREGLIRARLMGARYAAAPVLTYLDSHCECTEGWLEPLLDRIAREASTVVCPVIDVIDDSSLEFHYRDAGGVNVGGFDWNLQFKIYCKSSGWLEPLLDRIMRNSTTVVCPVIDSIDDNTLHFRFHHGPVSVGGFNWKLLFNWHVVPDREKKRHKNSAEPVWSPTMAGGLFAIDKKFFERLGTYDSGFDIWGGENLELSFKTWMCGGTLEIVPCSHVGHIFRKRSPYKWRSGVNVLKKNSIRLAEVWMDDYSKYYYERIGNDLGDYGDITSRKDLRRKLKCKSFKWYLENIYPELFIPGDAVASGEVRNLGYGNKTCLDSPARKTDLNKPAGLYPCHKMGGNQIKNIVSSMCVDSNGDANKPVNLWQCHKQGGNQYWMLSKIGEIRRDESCLDYAGSDVILYPCHGSKGNQYWSYNPNTKQLRHGSSRKCLAINDTKDKLLMEECDPLTSSQMWKFENFNATLATEDSHMRH